MEWMEYETSDIYLAAHLRCLAGDYKYTGHRLEGSKVVFLFDLGPKTQIRKLKALHFDCVAHGEGLVSAGQFRKELKFLKGICKLGS